MPSLHEPRRRAFAAILAARDLDAALVTDLVNVRYLTGFTGSNGALTLRRDGVAVLATDGRYVDQAAAECPDLDRITTRALTKDLVARLAKDELHSLAVETHAMSVDDHAALVDDVGPFGWRLERLDRAVEGLRVIKDETELAALRRACAISCEALTGLWDGPLVGRTEREIARDLEWRMLELGADAIGFDTIVAGGPNSAIPHHQPTDRPLEHGDLLKTDFGARVDGYHADCTRTVVLGPPADWQREIHAAVRDSQQTGLDACVHDRPVAEVDAAARDSLDAAGWLERFTTGLGHGVGLRIHEDPFLGRRHPGRLARRTPLTVEPGVYLPGRGGVRIEDTAVVGDGPPEVLTPLTKDLLVLG